MTREIKCKNGKCYDPEITLKRKMRLVFSGNSEADQIEEELFEKELIEE